MSSEPDRTESAPSADDLLVGQKIGKYEVVRTIGHGGMGRVYEAINTAINKRVAMKFVDSEVAENKDAVARFQREAQAASAVDSAHIVEIFDSGETEEGRPFIVMELLRGEDLGHRIKRCGRLDLPEALHIVAQILRGLHRAHKAGIVHRDLKPDNVFLVDRDDEANFAKILDFGISKMQRQGDVPSKTITRQGTVLGTPFYMAPEQAQALPDVDGRSDLWSVGAILYECLSGRPPHTGGTYEQVIVNICMKDPEDIRVHNPAVPEPVAAALGRGLARDREERYTSARQFLDALISASGGVLSARSGPTSGQSGDFPASAERKSGSSLTPTPARSDEYADTVEVGGPSRVGWSTSSGRDKKRDRRLFLAVAAASMALGGTGAVLYIRSPGDSLPGPSTQPEGYAASSTSESSVAEGPTVEPASTVEPTPTKPAASAAASASAASSATPVAGSADAGNPPVKQTPPAKGPPGKPPPVKLPPVKPPPAVPPPPPANTGVAPGLQLKTN